jgi:HlyD family secretion protein
MMKRAKLWIILLLVAGGGVGLWYYLSREKAPPPRATSVATVRRGDLRVTVSATGAVEPEFTVEIKSKASGVVRAVHVEVGDRVEKGAPLVEIDPLTEQRKLTQATAELRMAQAQRKSTATKLAHSRAQLKRDEALLGKGLVARESLDDLRKEVAVLTGELEVATAQILRARSSYQEARDRLAETKIVAPISGTILERLVQPGQVIASATSAASGGTTLLKIADLDRLFVRVKIDEADVTKLQVGQTAEVTADALPGRSFNGKVVRIAPQGVVESNVTVFDVIVELDAEGRKALRPMLTANIEILTAEARNVLLLPRSAVRGRGRRAFVILAGATPGKKTGAGGSGVRAEGRSEATPRAGAARPRSRVRVELGLVGAKEVEVRSGVTEGTRVVVPGAGGSRTGSPGRKRSATDPRSLRRMMGGGGRR